MINAVLLMRSVIWRYLWQDVFCDSGAIWARFIRFA